VKNPVPFSLKYGTGFFAKHYDMMMAEKIDFG
jgi:hypothetical protein